jgi:hypothetical protein
MGSVHTNAAPEAISSADASLIGRVGAKPGFSHAQSLRLLLVFGENQPLGAEQIKRNAKAHANALTTTRKQQSSFAKISVSGREGTLVSQVCRCLCSIGGLQPTLMKGTVLRGFLPVISTTLNAFISHRRSCIQSCDFLLFCHAIGRGFESPRPTILLRSYRA